jgi:iron-sulfur cluster assembly protein
VVWECRGSTKARAWWREKLTPFLLPALSPSILQEVTEEDHVESYSEHHFSCVVDPKSLLYLFGLRLDFKDQLIGGGFAFLNPNAQESCGCGSSFGV